MGRESNVRIPHNLLVLMRTAFLMESTVRTLDPDFNLVDGLLAKAPTFAEDAMGESASAMQVAPTEALESLIEA